MSDFFAGLNGKHLDRYCLLFILVEILKSVCLRKDDDNGMSVHEVILFTVSNEILIAVMSRWLVLLVSFGIALLACSRCGQARVGQNSVSTEILGDSDALPINRSAWEPRVDLTVSVLPRCVFQSEGIHRSLNKSVL